MNSSQIREVTDVLRACFEHTEIPEDFLFAGQTFIQRCEGWACHALEQLEDEVESVTSDGPQDERR